MNDQSPQISYGELQIAMAALQILDTEYLPLYTSRAAAGFPHYALCACVESLIVRAEMDSEAAAQAQRALSPAAFRAAKAQIVELLSAQAIAHPLIERHLDEVERFVTLVHALIDRATPATFAAALEVGPADLRLLHTILCCRLEVACDEALFSALRPLEVLRDYHFHLDNFEDARASGGYNPLVLYGRCAGRQAVAIIAAQKQRHEQALKEALACAAEPVKARLMDVATRYLAPHATASFLQRLADRVAQLPSS